MSERWELIRALAAVADNPRDARTALAALGLPATDAAEHTDVFVINCPPYASIHLGSEGGVGGEGADRVAGFWRAIGLTAPAEPDHLTSVLSLYASLAEAGEDARGSAAVSVVSHARRALFWEHVWSWVPNYLDAVTDLAVPAMAAWAGLTRSALEAEHRSHAPMAVLPLALREAPPPVDPDCRFDDLLDALVSPLRSGFVITKRRLSLLADHSGVGYRIGERRFALRSMFEQDARATGAVLGVEAERWSLRQGERATRDSASRWWSQRAAHTAAVLTEGAVAASIEPAHA